MSQQARRIDFIDLAKGFCIFLVVFYHFCGEDLGFDNPFNIFLRTFRMPLYFILSGLFFKEYEGFIGFLKRKVNKLLVPLFFFSCISAFIFFLIHNCWNTADYIKSIVLGLWEENIVGNMPLWFLWCLFLNNILFYIILLCTKEKTHFMLKLSIICILCGITGYILGKKNIALPLFLDTTLTTIPFFAFGYCLRKYTQVLYANRFDKYLGVQVLTDFLIVAIFMQRFDLYTNSMQYCSIYSLYVCGIAGSLGTLSLAKLFHKLPFLSYLGRYSIIILCTHMIPGSYLFLFAPLKVFFCIQSSFLFHLFLLIVLLILEYTVIIPIFKKYLPYFTAQKDLIPIS